MKCIQCGTDNNLKDRTANLGRCKNCQHPFAFEPTSMGTVKITDPMFDRAIAELSASDTLFFTPKQLFYFLDRRLKRKTRMPPVGCAGLYIFLAIIGLGIGSAIVENIGATIVSLRLFSYLPVIAISVLSIIITFQASQAKNVDTIGRKSAARALQIIGVLILAGGIILATMTRDFPILAIAVPLGGVAIFLGTRQRSRTAIAQTFLFDQNQFQDWVARWRDMHAPIAKMLPSVREERASTSANAPVNSEVTAYSFDRLVVCDAAPVAQMLIANNFHFENNCAILSITGYPQTIFASVMEMVRRNPDLKVYALHDCSPRGLGLVHHLKTSPQWFGDREATIIDIGLLPRQIFASSGMVVQASAQSAELAQQLPQEVRSPLTATELTWLEQGNFVELESFTPQRLIQVLNRGIAGSRELDQVDGSTDLFLINAGGYYTSDNFG